MSLRGSESVGKYFRDSLKRTIKHTSIAAVLVAVVGYYFTYQDHIDTGQQNAWNVVRTALEWSENKKWGNVGQIHAVETLSRDCDAWWINTPLKYLLGRNCEDLKSLSLMKMDFGGLNAPGAKLSYGFFACSNFADARLARARLVETQFMGAYLAGADLSGADLTKSCLFLADISGAKFDQNTMIDDPNNLLKACIRVENGARLDIDARTNAKTSQIASKIPICPSDDRCPLLDKTNGWNCGK